MIKLILLSVLGLYISFTRLYMMRTKKDKFSVSYWIKNNWIELSQSLALLMAIMMILLGQDTIVNIDTWFDNKMFPGEFHFPAKQVLSFVVGFSITEIMYLLNKKKKKWVKDNS